MNSPKDKIKRSTLQLNASPLARASYLIPAARRRQLSSGPLGGDSFRKFKMLRIARFHSVKDNRSKKNWLICAHSSNCTKQFF
jgi:hypothetical protein